MCCQELILLTVIYHNLNGYQLSLRKRSILVSNGYSYSLVANITKSKNQAPDEVDKELKTENHFVVA